MNRDNSDASSQNQILLNFDKQRFQGVLYFFLFWFTLFFSLVGLKQFFDQNNFFLGLFFVSMLLISLGILYLMTKAFLEEKQFVKDGPYLVYRYRSSNPEDEDRYLISAIQNLIITKEIQNIVHFFIFSWMTTEKVWLLGIRMNDQQKYWVYSGSRSKIQRIGTILSDKLEKEIKKDDDNKIPGTEAFL